MHALAQGALQHRALQVSNILQFIAVAIFIVVAIYSLRDIPKAKVAEKGYAMRRGWGIFVVLLLVMFGAYSFLGLPFPDKKAPANKMTITTMQYGFIPEPATVVKGKVRIETTSTDVNHGVGIYSPDGVLIRQVQSMPGKTNKLDVDFKETGTYTIRCMEYCGFGHHVMVGAVTVVDKNAKEKA